MKKNYLFKVQTIEKIGNLWEGSVIYVKKELKNYYRGMHSSYEGTFHIKVPKNKCIKVTEGEGLLEKYLKKMPLEEKEKLKKDWKKIKNEVEKELSK